LSRERNRRVAHRLDESVQQGHETPLANHEKLVGFVDKRQGWIPSWQAKSPMGKQLKSNRTVSFSRSTA